MKVRKVKEIFEFEKQCLAHDGYILNNFKRNYIKITGQFEPLQM